MASSFVKNYHEKTVEHVSTGIELKNIPAVIGLIKRSLFFINANDLNRMGDIIEKAAHACNETGLTISEQFTDKNSSYCAVIHCSKEQDSKVTVAYTIHIITFEMENKPPETGLEDFENYQRVEAEKRLDELGFQVSYSGLTTFLRKLKLEKYVPKFYEEEIDLEALEKCEEEELAVILGKAGISLGHDRKIKKALQERKREKEDQQILKKKKEQEKVQRMSGIEIFLTKLKLETYIPKFQAEYTDLEVLEECETEELGEIFQTLGVSLGHNKKIRKALQERKRKKEAQEKLESKIVEEERMQRNVELTEGQADYNISNSNIDHLETRLKLPSVDKMIRSTCLIQYMGPHGGRWHATGFLSTLPNFEGAVLFSAGYNFEDGGSFVKDFESYHLLFNNEQGLNVSSLKTVKNNAVIDFNLTTFRSKFSSTSLVLTHLGNQFIQHANEPPSEKPHKNAKLDYFALILHDSDARRTILKMNLDFIEAAPMKDLEESGEPIFILGHPGMKFCVCCRKASDCSCKKRHCLCERNCNCGPATPPCPCRPIPCGHLSCSCQHSLRFSYGLSKKEKLKDRMKYILDTRDGIGGSAIIGANYKAKGIHLKRDRSGMNEYREAQTLLAVVKDIQKLNILKIENEDNSPGHPLQQAAPAAGYDNQPPGQGYNPSTQEYFAPPAAGNVYQAKLQNLQAQMMKNTVHNVGCTINNVGSIGKQTTYNIIGHLTKQMEATEPGNIGCVKTKLELPSVSKMARSTCLIQCVGPHGGRWHGTGFLSTLPNFEGVVLLSAGHNFEDGGTLLKDFDSFNLFFNNIQGLNTSSFKSDKNNTVIHYNLTTFMSKFSYKTLVLTYGGNQLVQHGNELPSKKSHKNGNLDYFALILHGPDAQLKIKEMNLDFIEAAPMDELKKSGEPVVIFGHAGIEFCVCCKPHGRPDPDSAIDCKCGPSTKPCSCPVPCQHSSCSCLSPLRFSFASSKKEEFKDRLKYLLDTHAGMGGSLIMGAKYKVKGIHLSKSGKYKTGQTILGVAKDLQELNILKKDVSEICEGPLEKFTLEDADSSDDNSGPSSPSDLPTYRHQATLLPQPVDETEDGTDKKEEDCRVQ